METDADGRATLAGLPANTELVITEEQDGHRPLAGYFTTGSEDYDLGVRGRYHLAGLGRRTFLCRSRQCFDPALTAATSSSSPVVFFNVEPGDVEVTVLPDTLHCINEIPQSPTWKGGWVSSKPNTVRVRSTPGYLSLVRLSCE